jgi:hypothetical protein
MTSPLSPEAVAQMVAELRAADKPLIQSGPFTQTRERLRKAADMITTLAAENATLRASEAAALEALAEIGAVVAALEGKDSLDREMIRNIGTRIAALTPTADKEPKT